MYKNPILCVALLLASPLVNAKTLFCEGVTFLNGAEGTITFTIEVRPDDGILVVPTSVGELTIPIKIGSGEATYSGGVHTADRRWFAVSLNRFTQSFLVTEKEGESWRTEFNGICYERQPKF